MAAGPVRFERCFGVDDWLGGPYLRDAMLRCILTLLALLTGLAAVGTPAHALVHQAEAGVELASGSERAIKREACARVSGVRQALAAPRREPDCRDVRGVTIVIPTVQMGSDRAYE